MSDEIDDRPEGLDEPDDTPEVEAGSLDELFEEPGLAGEVSERDADRRPIPAGAGPGAGGRIGGLVALLAGIVGSMLAMLAAAVAIRFGFNASDTVDRMMDPVTVSFDRMDTRIDETDDLVGREGIDADRVGELQARADGLVDLSIGAHRIVEAIQEHPVASVAPSELSMLGDALAEFEDSSSAIDRRLGSAAAGDAVDASAAAAVADELDGMQSRVSGIRETISSASSSLRTRIRFVSFLGFIGALWGLWGQITLARRGWRGFRGRPA